MWRHARSSAAPVGGGRAWPGCPRRKFAHRTHKHGDSETNNAIAHPQQGTTETSITSAPEKCTTNAHFPPAKAIAVSIPHRHKRAKATTVSIPHGPKRAKAIAVSDKQATSPTGPGCGAHGRWRGLAGLRGAAPSHAPECQTPPEGAGGTGGPGCGARGRWRGLAGLRGAAPNAVRTPSLAGGRGRPAPGTPVGPQTTPSMRRAPAHGHTKQPGPPAPTTKRGRDRFPGHGLVTLTRRRSARRHQ